MLTVALLVLLLQVTSCKFEQSAKAYEPILVASLLTFNDLIDSQL